jgi:uncharacterized coiled-coil DUF342 family protein
LKKKESTKNKKTKKVISTFFSLILFAILSVGVFYGTYYFVIDKSASSYEVNVKQHIKDIVEENKKVSGYSKNNTLNSENSAAIIKGLTDITSKLNVLKTSASNEIPTEKYKVAHNNLLEGLNNNILLFKQILLMLQNPNSKDLDNSLSALDKYRAETTKNYQLFSVNNLKISLPKEAETFITNASNYISEISKINRDMEIQSSQILEFSQQLDTIVTKYEPLNSDFSLQLQKVRSKGSTYDELLKSIDEYKENYISLKKDFTAVSVPLKAKKIHSSFSSVLDEYNLYLQELKFAVSTEKTKAAETKTSLTEETLKSLYSSATSKYLTLDNKYKNFFKDYTTFKAENLK